MEAIGWIDVDEDGANLGCGELGDGPLSAVGRPDPSAISLLDAECQQTPCTAIHLFAQLRVGVAQVLMAHHQRLAVGKACYGAVEGVANGAAKQRYGACPA